ncbi:hypothetical protein EZV62_014516 [Acer yangbiense]|uniref:Uncharacterized protein n=1 Tax=Acer yangbiense TaxID=1000413 RepID=A0A5C7HS86_9ROSI|nr:hypothetical protein EZV62_014516 [Acer yangbiense]
MKKSSSLPNKLEDCRLVFTMSPLEVIEESVDRINVSEKLASFLENCMRGFCSIDCRDKQIGIDKFNKPYDYKYPEGDINIDNMKGSNLKNKASGSRSR